ncbi:MAG TPA: phosphate starvation-inducible protein PhoH [Chromatiales bacterium]|nr:phosphate starvation-inducible protein PhoH [Thiotrichales bacterium]HIP67067.1 phosphate starvation-inducible protein PhoH [Chromatiales bacterium]
MNTAKYDSKTIDIGKKFIWAMELFGLGIIALATVYASFQEVLHIFNTGKVSLADLLLLFLYLEILTMVGIYLESGALPVRLPMYIAIVALARYLILDAKTMDEWRILAITGGILLVAFSVLVILFAQQRYSVSKNITTADK